MLWSRQPSPLRIHAGVSGRVLVECCDEKESGFWSALFGSAGDGNWLRSGAAIEMGLCEGADEFSSEVKSKAF